MQLQLNAINLTSMSFLTISDDSDSGDSDDNKPELLGIKFRSTRLV